MRFVAVVLYCLVSIAGSTAAMAASCPGNPDAIGTSRTITVDPAQLPQIGRMQYPQTLPLNDHEVVLTFDDGPLPPYTSSILETLASECVKATYFLVGRQASAYPDMVRRIYNAGHTIGTHSQNHPLTFNRMSLQRVQREVDDGIASAGAALGNPKAEAPFFRIPGLLRSKQVEDYLATRKIAIWSADVVADDWFRHVTAKDIVRKAISRLEAKGRGVILLHDIHPATAMALPVLLRELKSRGYHIVQAVPAGERPKLPDLVASAAPAKEGWPRVTQISAHHGRMAKSLRHRQRLARTERDPETTAAISKKKHKAQLAESKLGWTSFQR
jgi:peptidoglycan/xylan/chitin deacetylase (PgdA/CDA1 family)